MSSGARRPPLLFGRAVVQNMRATPSAVTKCSSHLLVALKWISVQKLQILLLFKSYAVPCSLHPQFFCLNLENEFILSVSVTISHFI
jgi:hypothetical protein